MDKYTHIDDGTVRTAHLHTNASQRLTLLWRWNESENLILDALLTNERAMSWAKGKDIATAVDTSKLKSTVCYCRCCFLLFVRRILIFRSSQPSVSQLVFVFIMFGCMRISFLCVMRNQQVCRHHQQVQMIGFFMFWQRPWTQQTLADDTDERACVYVFLWKIIFCK